MNRHFLNYYNKELAFLRDLGVEFAERYPKIAGRLGLNAPEIEDPYVERLLEGFCFLTARIQLKMDAEYPRFVQRILEVTHPLYLTPLPASSIVKFFPNTGVDNASRLIERGRVLRSHEIRGVKNYCPFTCTQEVSIAPIEIDSVSFLGIPSDLPLQKYGFSSGSNKALSALRIKLKMNFPGRCSSLPLDKLSLFLSGSMPIASRLLYLLTQKTVGVLCHDAQNAQNWQYFLPNLIKQEGFDEEQSLFLTDSRVVHSLRLVQEYFAIPEKFLFTSIFGLDKALLQAEEDGHLAKLPEQTRTYIMDKNVQKEVVGYQDRFVSLTFLFNCAQKDLEEIVGEENVSLHCVPAVNLFQKNTTRFTINPHADEHHLVIDRTQPLDYEVYAVNEVIGYTRDSKKAIHFRPMYEPLDLGTMPKDKGVAYFSARRQPRVLSERAKDKGARASYLGSEVFISLVDQEHAPIDEDITHLAVKSWCTSRDLPLMMPIDAQSDFIIEHDLPVQKVKLITSMRKPKEALTEYSSLWAIVNQMGLNYLSLLDFNEKEGAKALRELLSIYAMQADKTIAKQIEGIHSVKVDKITRPVRQGSAVCMVRGVQIQLTVDELAFSGIHPYLIGSVLNQFFLKFVSINSFIQLKLFSLQEGFIADWQPVIGERPII
ncbi:type VI secretion system baseplate subunit TssF [Neisseria sp. Ec49-e6-T10]|uniref:type VI secretion system baseplate subunit TssF n=1 Tax=Neisseria sp. Ec49-e6-T10 TaxID=3140744 RepID=UPI003EC005D7